MALSVGLHAALALGALHWLRRESDAAGHAGENIRQSVAERELAAARAAATALASNRN